MYTLVFTAPRTLTAKFHVTKHMADAPSPKNKRLKKKTGSKILCQFRLDSNNSAGSMKRIPYPKIFRVANIVGKPNFPISFIRIEYKAQTAVADMVNKSPFGLTAIVPPEKLSK